MIGHIHSTQLKGTNNQYEREDSGPKIEIIYTYSEITNLL